MEFTQPNFDNLFDLNQPLFARITELNTLAVDTAKDIANVQFAAARTVWDFTTQSMVLPNNDDAGELLNAQVERTTKLGQDLTASAKAVYEIAESAREKAVAAISADVK